MLRIMPIIICIIITFNSLFEILKFTLSGCLVEWEGEVDFGGDVLTQTVRLRPKTITVEVKDDIAAY
jgi:hypothetical protein